LDSAVRLARRNARSVLAASAPYAVVASAATALLQYWTITSKDAAVIAAMGTLLIPAAFGAVLTGFLAPLYTSDLLGTPIAIGESARRVGRRTAALLVLGLAILVGEGIGLAACLAGGVWLWGVWAVAAPALVLERQGVRAAFRRSVALVRGTFWRVWGIRALGWLLTYVLGQLILLPLSLLALWASGADPLQTSGDAANAGVYVAILAGGQLISSAVLAPVSAAIDVLLYTDLRMRKEGMDIALRLPARPAPAGTGQPAVSAW
jgi:MFS family permease